MTLASTDLLALVVAIPLAALGGETFLRGILGVAAWLRLPHFLVATTLAAFATSSPELTVSTLAALDGAPGIGLGDALGSNVVNIALILGIALCFGPLPVHLGEIRRDYVLALAVPLLSVPLVADGLLSRAEAVLLLLAFALWMGSALHAAARHRRLSDPEAVTAPSGRALLLTLLGLLALLALLAAGRLFVSGAGGIASALGVHPYLIGATVVAIGTSLPELVTTLYARWRGHDEVGLGTLLGSNLFNGLAIVGVAGSIHPIRLDFAEVLVALLFGVLALLLVMPRAGVIPVARAAVLLGTYVAYVVLTLYLGAGGSPA